MIYKFFVAIALFVQLNAKAQNATEEAIKKVCTNETKAYLNRDFASLASYHVQSKDDILIVNSTDSSFWVNKGWDNISKDLKDYFKTSPKDGTRVENFSYTIKLNDAIASVAYESRHISPDGKIIHLYEFRTMLLINKAWKILSVQAFVNYKPE